MRSHPWIALVALMLMGVAAGARAESPPGRAVAVTVDDLPWAGPGPTGGRTVAEMLGRIASHLKAANAPSVGFVVGGRPELDAVRTWLDAGFPLGNHTLSHRPYSRMSVDEYLADAERNEDVVRARLGVELRGTFFRYPMLDHGHTEEKVAAMAAWLHERSYRHAPVSLDTVDYRFAQFYPKALDRGWIARLYVEHVRQSTAHFERLARRLYGEEIPLILLVHANELNAERLGEVLSMLVDRGYRFISLEEALAHPVYREYGLRPPLVPRRGDRNLLNQVALSRGWVIEDVSGDGYFDQHWKQLCEQPILCSTPSSGLAPVRCRLSGSPR